jgi:hypothetical protein
LYPSQIIIPQSTGCKIKTTHRPLQVAKWVSYGRKYDAQPSLSDELSTFRMSWWKWWKVLQPPARLKGGELTCEITGGPKSELWEETRKGSQNGFFMVLLTLAWWRKAAVTTNDVADFKVAFDDVSWVVDCMLGKGKRPRDDDTVPGPSKRTKTG